MKYIRVEVPQVRSGLEISRSSLALMLGLGIGAWAVVILAVGLIMQVLGRG